MTRDQCGKIMVRGYPAPSESTICITSTFCSDPEASNCISVSPPICGSVFGHIKNIGIAIGSSFITKPIVIDGMRWKGSESSNSMGRPYSISKQGSNEAWKWEGFRMGWVTACLLHNESASYCPWLCLSSYGTEAQGNRV